MDQQRQIEELIEAKLKAQGRSIGNKNSIKALLAILGGNLSNLANVFIETGDVVKEERHQIEQTEILNLLCKIDSAIGESQMRLKKQGSAMIKITGVIEAHAKNAKNLTNVRITVPVELKPGTHIITTADGVENVVGLSIGGNL